MHGCASWYILKSTEADKILESIAECYNGGSPMSSNIARKVLLMFANQQSTLSIKDEFMELSEREK
ncbi:MAG: hypothetical protein V4683_19775 [Bacteroidota bacterium]